MHRVLLAEDNKLNQVVAAGTLRSWATTSRSSTPASTPSRPARHAAFDAVLMDVMMPGMDGYQATAVIRAVERQRATPPRPIIGLSARAMDGRP